MLPPSTHRASALLRSIQEQQQTWECESSASSQQLELPPKHCMADGVRSSQLPPTHDGVSSPQLQLQLPPQYSMDDEEQGFRSRPGEDNSLRCRRRVWQLVQRAAAKQDAMSTRRSHLDRQEGCVRFSPTPLRAVSGQRGSSGSRP
jgi:hypothetical protein